MKKRLLITLMITGLACLFFFSMSDFAYGRVGGGHSYGGYSSSSGGSSFSGGGSSSSEGDAIMALIWLCFRYPHIGIPLVLFLAILFFMKTRDDAANGLTGFENETYNRRRSLRRGNAYNYNSGHSTYDTPPPMPNYGRGQNNKIAQIKQVDANFSTPLFLDFVNNLYSRLQIGRPGDLSEISCYLTPELREKLVNETKRNKISQVGDVIVGSCNIEKFVQGGGYQKLVVKLETNYAEVSEFGERSIYSVEQWTLARKANVLSQGPESITKLNCPSCGSPAELDNKSACKYCGKVILDGSFAWVLVNIKVTSRRNKPEVRLNNNAEIGTNFATIVDPNFDSKRKSFLMRHPDFVWSDFEQLVRTSFLALQKAWSEDKWEYARPYETDNLFATHRYWMESYKKQNLLNKVVNVKIDKVVGVKMETDAFYDSITVRIWASCLDYTINRSSGNVVSGSDSKPRIFTEYWTFIRRSTFQSSNEHTKNTQVCPNCGAPLKVSMAGVCEYCDSKITTGNFNWTLTYIEQDEAYSG